MKTTMTGADRKEGRQARLARRRSRGAVMVEYALLLTFVAVPTVAGLTIAGQQLYSAYKTERDRLLFPTP